MQGIREYRWRTPIKANDFTRRFCFQLSTLVRAYMPLLLSLSLSLSLSHTHTHSLALLTYCENVFAFPVCTKYAVYSPKAKWSVKGNLESIGSLAPLHINRSLCILYNSGQIQSQTSALIYTILEEATQKMHLNHPSSISTNCPYSQSRVIL